MKEANLDLGLSCQKPAKIDQAMPEPNEKTQMPKKLDEAVHAEKGKTARKFRI